MERNVTREKQKAMGKETKSAKFMKHCNFRSTEKLGLNSKVWKKVFILMGLAELSVEIVIFDAAIKANIWPASSACEKTYMGESERRG